MADFDAEAFARDLLIETLFYEKNFGVVGMISLVDRDTSREQFLGSYEPDDELFILEKATTWETSDEAERDYLLALDGDVVDKFDEALALADALLDRAREDDLVPKLHLLYEEQG